MPRVKLAVGGWFGASCFIAVALWACSSSENDLFSNPGGGNTSTGGSGTAGDGISGGTSGNGGTPSGGASGSSSGGVAMGGMPQTGGTAGEGGGAADSGSDSGGTTMGGMGGTGLTSGAGGAGTSGASTTGGMGMGGAGTSGSGAGGAGTGGIAIGGAGTGGIVVGGAGNGGTGGRPPGGCKLDTDCSSTQYCKKSSCDAEEGMCTARGPECRGDDAVFAPICGCDGITYWNLCTITHEGFNIASMGECTGNNRPTCTRDEGPDSCPPREHAHCYRPVGVCTDGSPDEGYCWVLPTECPDDEPQTERYCGGTAGLARCIGLCEVIDAENSFRRDAPACAAN